MLILKPDDNLPLRHNNVFPGENISSNADAVDPVMASVGDIPFAFAGMRYKPELYLAPPDARGFQVQWFNDGVPIGMTAEGYIYFPPEGKLVSLSARILLSTGELVQTRATPPLITKGFKVNVTPVPAGRTKEDTIDLKTWAIGEQSFGKDVEGVTTEWHSDDPTLMSISPEGIAKLLTDTAGIRRGSVTTRYNGLVSVTNFAVSQTTVKPLTGLGFSTADLDYADVGDLVSIEIEPTPSNTTQRTFNWTVNDPTLGRLVLTQDQRSAIFEVRKTSPAGVSFTVTANNLTAVYRIKKLTEKTIHVASVSITPSEGVNLHIGDSVILAANVLPLDAADRSGTWATDQPTMISLTPDPNNPLVVTATMLAEGIGGNVTFTSKDGNKVGTFISGAILPKPPLPALIDMTKATIDSRITYTGGSVIYMNENGNLRNSRENTWPLQYRDGIGIGRSLPELAGENLIKKWFFQNASPTAGIDNWRYSSGAPITFPGSDGLDMNTAMKTPNLWSKMMIWQDGFVMVPDTTPPDQVSVAGGWTRHTIKTQLIAAAQEGRFYPARQDASNYIYYSMKTAIAGTYCLSIFRKSVPDDSAILHCLPVLEQSMVPTSPIIQPSGTRAEANASMMPVAGTIGVTLYFSNGSSIDLNWPANNQPLQFPRETLAWGERYLTAIGFRN